MFCRFSLDRSGLRLIVGERNAKYSYCTCSRLVRDSSAPPGPQPRLSSGHRKLQNTTIKQQTNANIQPRRSLGELEVPLEPKMLEARNMDADRCGGKIMKLMELEWAGDWSILLGPHGLIPRLPGEGCFTFYQSSFSSSSSSSNTNARCQIRVLPAGPQPWAPEKSVARRTNASEQSVTGRTGGSTALPAGLEPRAPEQSVTRRTSTGIQSTRL